MPRLEVTGTDGFTQEIVLQEGLPITIGRSPENTLTQGGSGLSRRHATIVYADGLVFLEDHNSSNGTFLNGEEITRPQVLESGDIITCGELQLIFYED